MGILAVRRSTGISRISIGALSFSLLSILSSCAADTGNGAADATPPRVLITSPLDNASGVPVDNLVRATFSEAIDGSTADAATFVVTLAGKDVPGTVSFAEATIAFAPAEPFSLLSRYSVTATTGIRDAAGNGMAADNTWTFTTRDGSWGAAELAEAGTDNAASPVIAMDPMGNAMMVWMENNGLLTAGRIWSNRYTPGLGWGTARQIDAGSAFLEIGQPCVIVDPNGNAVALWRQSDGPGLPSRIWANRYTAGGGWETALPINTNTGNSMNPQVAMDVAGNAVAVWVQWGGTDNGVWTNRYEPGVGWGIPQVLTNTGESSFATVGMDGNGNAIVVWEQWDGTRFNQWANRYRAGSGWGTSELIESGDGDARFQQIAVDTDGNAVAAWAQSEGAGTRIWANRYRAGSGWGTADVVGNGGMSGWSSSPNVSVDSSGDAIIGWYAYDGTNLTSWVNTGSEGSGWGNPRPLSPGNTDSSIPSVAMDAYGNALALWRQWDGTRFNLWANRYGKDVGWGTAQLIETADGPLTTPPRMSMHSKGNAIVVWGQNDGSLNRVWANRFE